MERLFGIESKWENKEGLTFALLELSERQLELAELIAGEENSLNSAFLTEKEDSYKSTDASARAKAKAFVGSNKTKYEYEFQAITNLIGIVTLRISQL